MDLIELIVASLLTADVVRSRTPFLDKKIPSLYFPDCQGSASIL